MNQRELNPITSSAINSQALETARELGTCSDGKKCGVPPKVGDDAYCLDCPNRDESPGEQAKRVIADGHARGVLKELPPVTGSLEKQARYQDAKGEDWIDEFARTATADEFRGAMRFTIGKYNRRAGKKDALLSEIRKMRDYCQRWEAYEMALGDEQ
ncbi:MAG: hypothetical protein CME80_08380 [Halomonas sp.]|nr:hypothetical protein [Halomonas sp.]MBF57720.1 hypothetical protein [Halomonas sp.]|tara:strand:+ start:20087 stop:20557 length:471 start_codon:yes stop_codon:yes gene_type:complete